MIKLLGFVAIIGLFLAGCTHVNADDALENLDSSRSKVDHQVMELGKNLSAVFGGSPAIVQRRYGVCGSAPVDALEYVAVAEFAPDDRVNVGAVRSEITAAGWKVTDSTPARGVSAEMLFARRDGFHVNVGVKDNAITVGATGDCIRVTKEQANNLEPPKD